MRGRLHFLTPCMTRKESTQDSWRRNSRCITHIQQIRTLLQYLCKKKWNILCLFFFLLCREVFPKSSSSSEFRAALGESHQDNYLRTGIQGTSICLSFCWPPPHFFLLFHPPLLSCPLHSNTPITSHTTLLSFSSNSTLYSQVFIW